ncbi:glycosyl hydrolase family 28-related protein [Paenibacillus tarimensis]
MKESAFQIAMREMGLLIDLANANEKRLPGPVYNVIGYGAVGDGTTDDYPYLIDVLNQIGSEEATIVFPSGSYRTASEITFPSNVSLWFLQGGKLQPDSGVTITVNGPVEAELFHIFGGDGTIAGNMKISTFYAQWWGIKGDGGADDTVAFQKLHDLFLNSFSGTEMTIFFPPGEYNLGSSVTINNPLLRLIGQDATFAGTGRLIVRGCREITGFTFNGTGGCIFIPYNYDGTRLTIHRNKFLIPSEATNKRAIEFGLGFSTWASNVIIVHNEFDGHSYAVLGALSRGIIAYNRMSNSVSRNIVLYAGENTLIDGNTIMGGVTGVSFLCTRDVSNGLGGKDCVISNNFIRDITEEAISCDVRGNEVGKTGSIKKGTIASFFGGNPRQIVPDFTFSAYEYLRRYAVVLTGNARGNIYEIDYMGLTGTEALQFREATDSTTQTDFQIGDEFVIVVPYLGMNINNNVIQFSHTGISLWGNSHHCNVHHNRLRNIGSSAISINSAYGVVEGEVAPSFNNRIESNEISDGNIRVDAISYESYPVGLGHGNIVRNNRLLYGDIIYNYQEELLLDGNITTDKDISLTGTAASLPPAAGKYRGQKRITIGSAGVADAIFICLKGIDDNYSWVQL